MTSPVKTGKVFSWLEITVFLLVVFVAMPLYFWREQLRDKQLYEALQAGDYERSVKLIGRRVNRYDSGGYTPLYLALIFDHFSIAQYLIENGADINLPTKNELGTPPLFLCTKNKEHFEYMLSHGADLYQQDEPGDTILHMVLHSSTNMEDRVRYLLSKGLDINQLNSQNQTPLYAAVLAGNPDNCAFLLKLGAAVNVTDNKGMSPLYLAVFDASKDDGSSDEVKAYDRIVQMLLEAGATVNFGRWVHGKEIIRLADDKGQTNIARMLRHYQALQTGQPEEPPPLEQTSHPTIILDNIFSSPTLRPAPVPATLQ